MNTDQEQLDTWLAEVELAHNYITKLKNNEISIEELDKREQQKQQDKQKKEQKQKRLEEEKEEQIRLGRSGKGGDKNYISFCRHCFREYERLTPQCVHCQHTTISMELRHEELMKKVEEFKKNKTIKAERKKKWELWKKTKAMIWKKTSTNYQKWDVFTSSSEDETEKQEPILPKNDPNFLAMEKDIEERANKRKKNRKEAEQLKIKANEFMSQKNYQKAIEIYTEALELSRDFIILYTNRALAYIKIKKFKNAVEDCTKVTDYCECFEDGYLKSKDTCIKALLRRALANKELGKYYESRQDIKEVQKIMPNNIEAAKLFEEVQFLEEHKKQADRILAQQLQQQQQQKNNENNNEQLSNNNSNETSLNANNNQQMELIDMKTKVNTFLKNQDIKPEEIVKFSNYIIKNQDAKIYFFEQKGNIKLIEMMNKNIQNTCLLVNFFLQNNFIYQEEFYKKKGVQVIFNKINENIVKIKQQKQKLQENQEDSAKILAEAFDSLEEYFEIFVTLTNQEKMRNILNQAQEVVDIIKELMPLCLDSFEDEPEMVSSFLSFVSNLCYGPSSLIKKHIESQLTILFPKLQEIIVFHKKKTSFENLRVNIYNFISNLLTETSIRQQFHQFKGLIQGLVNQFEQYNFSNNRWVARSEALLAIFINATFQQQQQQQQLQQQQQQQQQTQSQQQLQSNTNINNEILNVLQSLNLTQKLYRFLFSSKSELYRNVTMRALQVLSKLKFSCSTDLSTELIDKLIKNYFSEESVTIGFTNHALRLMLNIIEAFSSQQQELQCLQKYMKDEIVNNLCTELIKIIQSDDYQRFCNGCNLAGKIVQIFPNCQQNFKPVIERLLFIIKEKVGLERKNAAILVAKLAKNEQNLEQIRNLHGIEILHSLSQFLL